MPKGNKKNLRKCGGCNKVGHNKATCLATAAISGSQKPRQRNESAPLKFFVHHVTDRPQKSGHVINLKNEEDSIWHQVTEVSPEKTKSPLFYYHHQIPKEKILKAPIVNFKTSPKLAARPAYDYLKITKAFKNIFLALKAKSEEAIFNFKKIIPQSFPLPKTAFVTALIVITLTLPAHAENYYSNLKFTVTAVKENGQSGFENLLSAVSAIKETDFNSAENKNAEALGHLTTALGALSAEHPYLQSAIAAIPLVGKNLKDGQDLLIAGQEIALGNSYLLGGLKEIETTTSTLKRFHILSAAMKKSLPQYSDAEKYVKRIDSSVLPESQKGKFQQFQNLFSAFVKDLESVSALEVPLSEIFGGNGRRKYLLIFQNPAELRATGGFMGSFAVLDVKDGNIINLTIPAGGTYDLAGQLDKYVEPPSPLLIANKRWEFQDANWFPDFPKSAQKILWFYRHGRGISADGVIAINSSVLTRLLAIMGPVTDDKRGLTISAENALSTLQQIVETGPEKKANRPKQILSDLAPSFIDYFKNLKPGEFLPLALNLESALEQKEIQAYFSDERTQKVIADYGWGGKMLETKNGQDYLMVVNSNIQGQKSDIKMKQNISHQSIIETDGSIANTVVITRVHGGTKGEQLYGQSNINYLRIYVPEGSELISAGGFSWPDEKNFRAPDPWTKKDEMLLSAEKETGIDERTGTRITSEFGKTAFGNWVVTEPGEMSQIQFSYRLPFKIIKESSDPKLLDLIKGARREQYQLVLQKQSGSESEFESQIILPQGWQSVWEEGQNITRAQNGISIKLPSLTKDTAWGMLIKQK